MHTSALELYKSKLCLHPCAECLGCWYRRAPVRSRQESRWSEWPIYVSRICRQYSLVCLCICGLTFKCACMQPTGLSSCVVIPWFLQTNTSVASFKSVAMVGHLSCFELSAEVSFAELHLSTASPLRLSFTSRCEAEAQIIYSCLSPNSAPNHREMRDGKIERKRRARAVLLSCNCRRQKQMDDSFS